MTCARWTCARAGVIGANAPPALLCNVAGRGGDDDDDGWEGGGGSPWGTFRNRAD